MDSSFRVIVVGGGPIGLTAAHALSHAGLDFVLLERRESVVVDAGASLVLMPSGLRVMAQLGLLDTLGNVSSALWHNTRQDHDGNDLWNYDYAVDFNSYLGARPRVVSRHEISKTLYESLPDRAKVSILSNKKVSCLSTDEDGVSVTCADGTAYRGSIVIGADGAHSIVRQHVRALNTGLSHATDDERSFVSTYRCLWMRFPLSASSRLEPGTASETHGPGTSTQLFCGPDSAVVAIYERLDSPTEERVRYTEADERSLIERRGDLSLLPGHALTMRRAYDLRIQSGMVDLEEGVAEHWSGGSRFVLVGDAAHKFTPNTGSGCNQGMVDVFALGNELYKAVASRDGDRTPAKESIEQAFQAYQDLRKPAAVAHCRAGGRVAATSTWSSAVLTFVDRWVFSLSQVRSYFIWKASVKESQMPMLSYVPGEERFTGSVPWVNPVPSSVGV
ncbi:2-polyprenyl-6-methoxyphenol hydroxylase [Geosmithia morbida]|uniref:2-polyprenyl-6-methoxyphenol hydroxylase n=1 Tax=Geosmithia morbida TaxID=1094350 RepID=A0A9P5D535_9HYPO|nr:2-polyprenyl-6-methoxyphenol hydroxylase [Geosmithia morbida]KAF4122104.1 2-polyprenyl-6-methoxyphenol hydroxylase [Geosmithia morbida]